MAIPKSPLAPTEMPAMPPVPGVRLGAMSCGIRYSGRTDLCMIELDPGTTVGGVFTRSLTSSAPVDWCRAVLPKGTARAAIINSGNANAFTGKRGEVSVGETARKGADVLGCDPESIFLASTGVIGEPLPHEKIVAALETLHGRVRADGWADAATAIMTTDTFPKYATRTVAIDGVPVTVNGIAKGSGMIAPDMATMLAFVATDAALPAPVVQRIVTRAADRSFNAITVDGDTSTSDTVLMFATGRAAHAPVSGFGDRKLAAFKEAVDDLMAELARQIVRDGEGATKFVTIRVSGAASARAARRIGLAIGNSPLVKTAIAGEDANWGRIVMAVGKSGEKADRDQLKIVIGGVTITEFGGRVPGYDEAPVAAHMKGQDINIEVDVGVGRGTATVWTCDLTHGYIDINADYRS